jgi:hypothetical protein
MAAVRPRLLHPFLMFLVPEFPDYLPFRYFFTAESGLIVEQLSNALAEFFGKLEVEPSFAGL